MPTAADLKLANELIGKIWEAEKKTSALYRKKLEIKRDMLKLSQSIIHMKKQQQRLCGLEPAESNETIKRKFDKEEIKWE